MITRCWGCGGGWAAKGTKGLSGVVGTLCVSAAVTTHNRPRLPGHSELCTKGGRISPPEVQIENEKKSEKSRTQPKR